MNKHNIQAPESTPWYVRVAEFSWRAPLYAFLVVIVGNVVGFTMITGDMSMQHVNFFMVSLFSGAAMIAAGLVASLFGILGSAKHRRFSPLFSAFGGLIFNGGVICGLVVLFGEAWGI